MDLSDLESKLFDEPKPVKKAEAPKPVKAEKPEKPKKAEKAEKPKKAEAAKKAPEPEPEPLKLKLLLKEPEEAPKQVFKPSNTAASRSVKYELPSDLPTKVVKQTPPSAKFEVPKFEAPKLPSFSLPAPKPKPVAPPKAVVPAQKDSNAIPAGLALGAVPLVLAPLALLGAGRGALANTKERREKIQQEIAAAEAAKQKRLVKADVDGEAAAGAVVSMDC